MSIKERERESHVLARAMAQERESPTIIWLLFQCIILELIFSFTHFWNRVKLVPIF